MRNDFPRVNRSRLRSTVSEYGFAQANGLSELLTSTEREKKKIFTSVRISLFTRSTLNNTYLAPIFTVDKPRIILSFKAHLDLEFYRKLWIDRL